MASLTTQIQYRLQQVLQPEYLIVENESFQHQVPPGSESHFKIIAVSTHFNSTRPINRERMVHQALQPLLKQIHALAIRCYTPQEWALKGKQVPSSPPCQRKRSQQS